MVLERLDGLFYCIDSIIVGLHELPFAVFFFEEDFQRFGSLFVGDIEEWRVAFSTSASTIHWKALIMGFSFTFGMGL